MGIGNREISERCSVVFLSFLAAEISLRRTRIRYQERGRAGMDSLCCGGNRMPGWRKFLKPPCAAPFLAWRGPENCAGAERRNDAVYPACSTCAHFLGTGDIQPRVLWPAIVVNSGHGAAGGFVSPKRRGLGRGAGGFRRSDGRHCLWATGRLFA